MTVSSRFRHYNDWDHLQDPAPRDALQGSPEAIEWHAIIAALENATGWIEGIDWTTDGTMTLAWSAGFIKIGNDRIHVAAGDLTAEAPDGQGYARMDSVRCGRDGVPYIAKGLGESVPVSPALHRDASGAVDEVLLLSVLVEAAMPDGFADAHLCGKGVPPVTAIEPTTPPIRYLPIIAEDGLPSLASSLPWYSDFTWYDPTPGFEAYYVVWINALHEPVLGAWGINDRYWKRHPLGSTQLGIADKDVLHNYIGIGMDADGFLHLSGNEHSFPLRYIRSQYSMRDEAAPDGLRDIKHWINDGSMTGVNEEVTSFPMFGSLPTGELMFMIPQAGPGSGAGIGGPHDSCCSLKMYRGDNTWEEIGARPSDFLSGRRTDKCLIDSHEPVTGYSNATSFMGSSTIDSNGDLHLIWNWRGETGPFGGGVRSSYGWYYAKITGLHDGETPRAWRNPDSTDEITLPIAREGSAYSDDHYPLRVATFDAPNLINNPAPSFSMCDASDSPHTGFLYIVGPGSQQIGDPDGGRLQLFHLWFDDAIPDQVDQTYSPAPNWHVMQVSSFVTQGAYWSSGTPAGSASRFQPFCTPTGKVYFIGCWPNEGFGTATWAYDVTGLTGDDLPPKPFKLHALPDQGDFHYDLNSQRANRLVMLMTSKQRWYQDPADPAGSHPYQTDDNPDPFQIQRDLSDDSNGILGLVIEDCAQFAAIARGDVLLPTIRPVESASASKIAGIQATTPTGVSDILEAQTKAALNALRAAINGSNDIGNNTGGNAEWADLMSGIQGGSSGGIVIDPQYAGKQLFARLKFDGELTAGNGFLAACIICQNFQEVNAQVMLSGEAENVVPVAQTPVKWVLNTDYAVDDEVMSESAWWRCTVAVHYNGTDNTVAPPDNAAHWVKFADLTGWQRANIAGCWVIDNAPTNNVKASTWIALPNFRDLNGCIGRLVLGTFVGGVTGGVTETGFIASADWQLGVLED